MYITQKALWLLMGAALAASAGAQTQTNQSDAADLTSEQVAPMLSVRATRFKFLDTDGNGYITGDEVKPDNGELRSQFDSLDADGDKRLSQTEYVLSHRRRIGEQP